MQILEDAHASSPISEDANSVRSSVLGSSTTNPALQRLQGRLLASAQTSDVITSYDRMHHRHSRS
jgi:hypothetical protein